MKNDT